LDQGRAERFSGFPGRRAEPGVDGAHRGGRGSAPDIAKPLKGLGSGIWELAIKSRGDAFRIVYVLQLGDDIWVVHAFQKKSKKGIATPKYEIDLVRERVKRLKEYLG
jgi:phage-related protein